ncbi:MULTISPECIES: ABC transporter permease [unclassified Enterococcus]|uniref:ABC transporter permease n=1 Tax=unclassified Enterococcus TaxID=2608891 RepID=UPI0015580C26|nr:MULTISPECIES: ABC transporter permease [unclassified Enterococcus]MBS7578075.1 ABC transporter permease [Enterococcus sp. MMGLQ5-2]MBS7585335.1 ABC transporter permease [Enterococcus sp. MMGLQ5-1]NPD13192.1 ABC transporter permease [Enterococcus sp. MMGLQ5-1]NPD37906.1 ABC transporter permease [Enterococcus sp. MMGLQ5-2]
MASYVFKRIFQAIPLLLIISFIVFSLIHLAPYDVIDSITTPNMSSEQVELLRDRYGLNDPFFVQYFKWLNQIIHGDFGYSLVNQRSITAELLIKIPNTIRLVLPAYITALLLAIILGLIAAANKGKLLDRLVDGIASIGIAVPTFWFAMILIYYFGYRLNLFPIIGMHTVGRENDFNDFLAHFILPYLTLTVAFFPDLTRYIRASANEQVTEDYVTVQSAFQASKWQIFSRHISRNILIPIVTQIGLALPMLVTGAIITESIFGWPGVGPYLMSATKSLDYPVIMALLLLSATLVILGNLLSDILYSVVDPRIRRGGQQ